MLELEECLCANAMTGDVTKLEHSGDRKRCKGGAAQALGSKKIINATRNRIMSYP